MAARLAKLPASFYPRHPRGWRLVHSIAVYRELSFLSTPPSRVATLTPKAMGAIVKFLSTPPSRVATYSYAGTLAVC